MGLITGIGKDAKIFARDAKNVVLIFLTPIIIMWVLGNVFADTPQEEVLGNIRLGFCNHEPSFKLVYPLKTYTPANCEQQTAQLVNKGELRGSLIVPKSFFSDIKEGHGTSLNLFLDNSKAQTSFALQTSFEAMVNKLNEEIGVTFISEAWENLRELNGKLRFAADNLEEARLASLRLKGETARAQAILEQFQVHEEYVQEANASIADVRLGIDAAKAGLALVPDLQSIDLGLQETAGLSKDLQSQFDSGCVNCVENQSCLTPSACDSLNKTIADLIRMEEQQERAEEALQNMSQAGAAAAQSERAKKARERLMQVDIARLEQSIDDAAANVRKIEESRKEALGQIKDLHRMVTDFSSQIITLQSDLRKSAEFLEKYTDKDPKNIVRPVTLNTKKAFGEKKKFDFVAPGVMMIALMLVTLLIAASSLVAERRGGTMVRTVLSPRPLVFFIIEKMIFLLALCAVEIALMLIVAAFFGVFFPFNPSFVIALCIASITFVSMGILIGAISKTENTALLTSLVLAIPMMFLSGVFFQFEAMPKFMNFIGNISPLTLTINLLEDAMTYQVGIDGGILFALISLSIVCIGIAIPLLRRSAVVL
ncbi:ABC transporter permease [Candidatus Woesearchaeota archaeon]|nr:ABC transporter permease [Candidatus Woesearchaeota archaeon]